MCGFADRPRRLLAAAALLACCWAALSGCGAGRSPAAARPSHDDVRAAAVWLMLTNLNATALPRAYDRRVLRARLRRYVARASLDARVALVADSIAKLGGRAYAQAWTDAITVGRWEAADVDGGDAAVVFVGYSRFSGAGPSGTTPLARFTVSMRREQGRWKLVSYRKEWLTSAGPSGDSGALTIRSLPERAVFRDPRPG